MFALVEAREHVPRRSQRSIEIVGPGMVRAHQDFHIARGRLADVRTAMAADIGESAKFALGAANDYDALAGDLIQEVVAGPGSERGMCPPDTSAARRSDPCRDRRRPENYRAPDAASAPWAAILSHPASRLWPCSLSELSRETGRAQVSPHRILQQFHDLGGPGTSAIHRAPANERLLGESGKIQRGHRTRGRSREQSPDPCRRGPS